MIKNIIFDQGGIILNIDYNLTAKAFNELGATTFNDVYSQKKQSSLFDLYDTGKISSAEFRKLLKNELGINHISDDDFDNAWNAMLLDLPIKRLAFINDLKRDYRVFILSNANYIHMEQAAKIFHETTGNASIDQYFHKTYYSHIAGLRKPDSKIFQLVLQENSLLPEETLFIDDSLQHIHGAKKLGINVLHLLPGQEIIDVLPNILISTCKSHT